MAYTRQELIDSSGYNNPDLLRSRYGINTPQPPSQQMTSLSGYPNGGWLGQGYGGQGYGGQGAAFGGYPDALGRTGANLYGVGGGPGMLGGGHGLVDPTSGQLLRMPSSPQEAEYAQMQLENFHQGQAETDWQRRLSVAKQGPATEPTINKGTDEINESQASATMAQSRQAAAAGFRPGGGTQMQGENAINSQYAGMRANLARDVRGDAANKAWEAQLISRPRPPQYPNYNLANASGFGANRGGGGGIGEGTDSGWSIGGGHGLSGSQVNAARAEGMDPYNKMQPFRQNTKYSGGASRGGTW